MACVRTRACPSPEGVPRFVTEQKHNFVLETKEPLLAYDRELFWWPRPHVRGTVWSTPGVRTNSLGLRQGPVDSGRRRVNILVVGDSVVWGSLVHEHERFTNVAAGILRQRPECRDVQVINAGVVGFTSHQVHRYLKGRGLGQFHPRIVVVCVGVNDAWPVVASDRAESLASASPGARIRHVLRRSDVFLLLERYLTELRVFLTTGVNPEGFSFLNPAPGGQPRELRVAPAETERNFQAIGQIVEAHDAKLMVLLETTMSRQPPTWNARAFSEAQRRVRNLCQERGWSSIELARLADMPWSTPEGYLQDFCHLSPAGHEILARWLVDGLQRILPQGS
jgi:lysophospholipase L1-like esterase